MTVDDMITVLKKYPGDMKVCVHETHNNENQQWYNIVAVQSVSHMPKGIDEHDVVSNDYCSIAYPYQDKLVIYT